MAINVNVANAQAGQLSGYSNQLVSAKNQLSSYKSSILTYWQGQEVSYIVRGIDQKKLDEIMKKIKEAERKRNACYNALNAARR